MEIILRRIKQTNTPNNGGGGSGSAGGTTTSPSSPTLNQTTTTTMSNTSGHRENLNIEEIKQELFVNDRGIIILKFMIIY